MLCALQMVWEQGVVVIVNLTKLSDLGLVSVIEINQRINYIILILKKCELYM